MEQVRTSTPCNRRVPPKPPSKTIASVSRLFQNQSLQEKPVAISFKDNVETSRILDEVNDTTTESYFERQFHVDKIIGSGSFGDVFRVKSRSDGRYYAVKKSRYPFKGRTDREHKLKEVAKHEMIPKHPNLVEFFKAWEEKSTLYIQIELCECSLLEFIENYREMDPSFLDQPLPEELVWNFLIDLLMAVSHLHDHDLIHLDIKPENIFISKGICKLGDFGLMVDLNQKEESDHAIEGDPKYMAQELMRGKFSKSADIFSLGISMLEISCDLDLPSGGEGWHSLRSGSIQFEEFNCTISQPLMQVISIMMSPDPKDRPSASGLLSTSPFVKSLTRKRVLRVTFVEISKKLRNFFLLILHYLSLILFVDYFHDIISSDGGSHNDESTSSIVDRLGDETFNGYEYYGSNILPSSPIHLDSDDIFDMEDDHHFLGIKPLPKLSAEGYGKQSNHRYELRSRKPRTGPQDTPFDDSFDIGNRRRRCVTSPAGFRTRNSKKQPISTLTIHSPSVSKLVRNKPDNLDSSNGSSVYHPCPDSPAVLTFASSALLSPSKGSPNVMRVSPRSGQMSPNGLALSPTGMMRVAPKMSPRVNISHGSSYDFSDDEGTNESLLEPNIGPKNLLSIFEQLEREEKEQ